MGKVCYNDFLEDVHGARGWTVSVWSTMSWLNLSTWVSPFPILKVSEDRSDSPNSWYVECLYEEVFHDHYKPGLFGVLGFDELLQSFSVCFLFSNLLGLHL